MGPPSTGSTGLVAAMFDPAAVDDPTAFRTDRPASAQLVFGHGLHSCFGEVINRMHIHEIVAALLEAGPLTRAPEGAGRLSYDGPFAANLVVADPDDVVAGDQAAQEDVDVRHPAAHSLHGAQSYRDAAEGPSGVVHPTGVVAAGVGSGPQATRCRVKAAGGRRHG